MKRHTQLLTAALATACLAATGNALAVTTAGDTMSGTYSNPSSGTYTSSADAALVNSDDYSGDARYDAFYNQELEWSQENCGYVSNITDQVTWECALVDAPVNWHNPESGTIKVGIGRIPAFGDWDDKENRRLLMSNPGGPGGSGIDFGTWFDGPLGLRETHNTIGIDPRGVGLSTNLNCPAWMDLEGKETPWSDGDSSTFTFDEVKAGNEEIAINKQACLDANEGWVEFVNTEQTARDFNLVRHVLGYDTADMYGVSYGTWLGSTMERLFPNNFDRVMLDGNLDWTTGSIQESWVQQGESMQAASDQQFTPFLARHHDHYGLGATTREVNANIEKIREGINAGLFGEGVIADDFDNKHFNALYGTWGYDNFGMLAKDMLAVVNGESNDIDSIRDMFGVDEPEEEFASPQASVFSTLRCADTRTMQDPYARFNKTVRDAQHLPLLAPAFVTLPCAGWDVEPAMTDELFDKPVGDVLMLQNEGDPATGYYGGIQARYKAESTGTIRIVSGDDLLGHGLPWRNNECFYDIAHNYMANGVLPDKDMNCQAGPIAVKHYDQEGTMELIADDDVYEFLRAGVQPGMLPKATRYSFRDLRDPEVDVLASERFDAQSSGSSSNADGSASTGIGWGNAAPGSPEDPTVHMPMSMSNPNFTSDK